MNDNLNKTIFQNALIHVTCCRLTSDLEIKHLHLGQGKGNEFCQILSIWTKIKVRVITMHLSLHFVVTLWQYFTFFDVEIHIQAPTKIAITNAIDNLSAVKKWPYH